jgi:hypothetical protein
MSTIRWTTTYRPYIFINDDGTVGVDFNGALLDAESQDNQTPSDYTLIEFDFVDPEDCPEAVQRSVRWVDSTLANDGIPGLLRKIADQLDEQAGA